MARVRWVRRWAVRGVLLIAVVALVGLGWLAVTRISAGSRLSAYRAELDRAEPGWQWADVTERYDAGLPTDDQNYFLQAHAASQQVPKWLGEWYDQIAREGRGPGWSESQPHRRPRGMGAAELRCIRDGLMPAIALARPLAGRTGPAGYRFAWAVDPISINCGPVQDVRQTAAVLKIDAMVSALSGDGEQAVHSTRALLGTGRSLGDAPFHIVQLIRMACCGIAVESSERTLALCEPTAGLAELQAELLAEADHPRLRIGAVGDRALYDAVYDNFRTGQDSLPAFMARYGLVGRYPDRVQSWEFGMRAGGEHLGLLQFTTAAVRVAEAPDAEMRQRLTAVPTPAAGRTVVASFLQIEQTPDGVRRLVTAHLRTTAHLRAAAAGVACERFRQAAGRWPNDLGELGAFLPVVPIDPFTGKPLLFRRVPGGAVVYSTGPDGTDDGGNAAVRLKAGTDVGFRLFDVDRRGSPANDE